MFRTWYNKIILRFDDSAIKANLLNGQDMRLHLQMDKLVFSSLFFKGSALLKIGKIHLALLKNGEIYWRKVSWRLWRPEKFLVSACQFCNKDCKKHPNSLIFCRYGGKYAEINFIVFGWIWLVCSENIKIFSFSS